MTKNDLPIFRHTESILDALKKQSRIILNAPTGSGKSTGLPPLLVQEKVIKGRILIVQPRRLAARLLAFRVAQTLGVKIGEEVGYAVRFDAKFTSKTKILFLTDGVLLRQLRDNAKLQGVGLIIFDEFHERRIASDVALGYCKGLQEAGNEHLKVLVMSATLASDKLENYLSPCATINAEGRSFPVEIFHRTPKPMKNSRTGRLETPHIWEAIKALSKDIVQESETGNWLIFLPGMHEIRKTIEALESASWLSRYAVYPLYSSLPPAQQDEAITSEGPKIIISTNVAETSLTIPGVLTVIDSGLVRESRYDPTRDMDSLLIRPISRASATQRSGRAGRTGPGRSYRLWSASEEEHREEFSLPESLTLDLAPSLLLLASMGYCNKRPFPWLDVPSRESVTRANEQLMTLGAVDNSGKLTKIGEQIAQLPLPPRLARLVLAGDHLDCLPEVLFTAAYLQGEPLVKRSTGIQNIRAGQRPRKSGNSISEFEEVTDTSSFSGLYMAFHYIRENRFSPQAAKPFGLSLRAARELDKTLTQLCSTLQKHTSNPRLRAKPDFLSRAPLFAQAVSSTFADRLCIRLGKGTLSARLLGNKKGKLEDCTCARSSTLFYATQIQEIQGKDVLTHLSGLVSVEPSELKAWYPEHIKESKAVVLDEVTNKFVSQSTLNYSLNAKSLLIHSEISNEPPDTEQTASLIAALIHEGKVPLPLWNEKVRQWIARLNCLAEWMPELELPPIYKDDEFTLLEELCQGVTRLKEVKQLDPWPVLQEWLSPLQTQTLKSYAPTEVTLSNGRKVKVTYAENEPPTIAMKLQHLYDVTRLPALCNGTVTLRLQILAPNQRPWQITSDLENFWENGYPQMKKDLAGRYPKHDWR